HTLEVQNGQLQKARETHHARCLELDRLRKESAPQKELEKVCVCVSVREWICLSLRMPVRLGVKMDLHVYVCVVCLRARVWFVYACVRACVCLCVCVFKLHSGALLHTGTTDRADKRDQESSSPLLSLSSLSIFFSLLPSFSP